jgi:hypothetical protein
MYGSVPVFNNLGPEFYRDAQQDRARLLRLQDLSADEKLAQIEAIRAQNQGATANTDLARLRGQYEGRDLDARIANTARMTDFYGQDQAARNALAERYANYFGEDQSARNADMGRRTDFYGEDMRARNADMGRRTDFYGEDMRARNADMGRRTDFFGEDMRARNADIGRRTDIYGRDMDSRIATRAEVARGFTQPPPDFFGNALARYVR